MSTNLVTLPTPATTSSVSAGTALTECGRSVEDLLSPLNTVAERSNHLFNKPLGRNSNGQPVMPRYFFLGPQGGGDYLRLGVFAGIHGDEPAGSLAAVRFLTWLDQHPEIARGYAVYVYPVCNPTGFETGTRLSRSGRDLNREFWRRSPEPEVRWLETEIWTHAFHGIITLHSDDTSDGVYGFVNGAVLSENLLEPALLAAERHLPRNPAPRIDGFPARRGIIYEGYDGTLRSVPGLKPGPFEITFETPHHAPLDRQVDAFHAALRSILVDFRVLQAIGQGI